MTNSSIAHCQPKRSPFSSFLPAVAVAWLTVTGCGRSREPPRPAPVPAAKIEEGKVKPGQDVYTLGLPGNRYFRIKYVGPDQDGAVAKFMLGFGDGTPKDFTFIVSASNRSTSYEFIVPVGKSRTIGGGALAIELSVDKMFAQSGTVNVSVKGPTQVSFVQPGEECASIKPIYTLKVGDYMLGMGIEDIPTEPLNFSGNVFTRALDPSANAEMETKCKTPPAKEDDFNDRFFFGKITAVNPNDLKYQYITCADAKFAPIERTSNSDDEEDSDREPQLKRVKVIQSKIEVRTFRLDELFTRSISVLDPLTGQSNDVPGVFFRLCQAGNSAAIVRSCKVAMPDMDRFIDGLLMDTLAACIKSPQQSIPTSQ